ncbi:MAG: hypothetical protein H0U84_08060 [Thermoleophilaceae bacterium]|nr:hypothetical protein [Thermoleophilaceae bacterium]
MTRRTIAIAAGLVVLLLFVFLVRGCLDARQERAIEDYADSASALVRESNQQSEQLFQLLQGSGGPDQVVDAQNTVNGFRVQSAQIVDRARDLDVPDDASQAQRYLLETLEFRRDGLARVAEALPNALGDESRRQGSEGVTAQMQVFLASDVIYAGRFEPSLNGVLEDQDIAGISIPPSEFIPDIEWLDPARVRDAVTSVRTGQGATGEEQTGGLHGSGLGVVTLGGTTLNPGVSASVQLSTDLAFDVQVANQGDSTETDVVVEVEVGEGDDAITLEGTLDTIAAGETKSVPVTLEEQPPTGQNVSITVTVQPVPGEGKTDNNSQTFSVIFTR